MKKFLTVLSIFVLTVLLTCSTVFADDNVYRVDEAGLQITIPSDYYTLTRATPPDDVIFSLLGISKEELLQQWEERTIFLDAVYISENMEEITLTMTDSPFKDFGTFTDFELNAFFSSLSDTYSDSGMVINDYKIYDHSQTRFLKLMITSTDQTLHGIQYCTSNTEKMLFFTLSSFDREITEKELDAMQAIIDSIVFDHADTLTVKEDCPSFVYTDAQTGASFIVPENWNQEDLTTPGAYIDAKFLNRSRDGGVIIYASTDVWAQMPASEKIGHTRSSASSAYLTTDELIESIGIAANDPSVANVSTVTYDGITYCRIDLTKSINLYGFDFSSPIIMLFYLDNGWGYTFQFYGDENSSAYSDFEALIRSAQYPVVDQPINPKSVTTALFIIASPLLVAAVAAFVIRSRKKRTTADQLQKENTLTQTIYCRNCGAALPEDSMFCHKCGTRIHQSDTQ